MIPENTHTIPWTASWNSEGVGRFLGLQFQRHGWSKDVEESVHVDEWADGLWNKLHIKEA